jgi:hypothetical protein
MKKLLILLLCMNVTLLLAQPGDKVNPSTKTFKFYKGKSIVTTDYDSVSFDYAVGAGNNIVFDYYYKASDHEMIADDEYSERLLFQVSSTARSFRISGANLLRAKTIFNSSCFCLNAGNYKISKGWIKGTRINASTWKIQADITTVPREGRGNPIHKKISGTFRLSAKIN